MAESEDTAGAAARLEAALERIARSTADRPASTSGEVDDTRAAEIGQRLDNLIAQLRRALAKATY